MKSVSRFLALAALLLLGACAAQPEVAQSTLPVPTLIQLTFTGNTTPVLGTGDTGKIELTRKGVDEPILLDFQNGVAAVHDLPPGRYSVKKIGVLDCRAMTFDIDPSAGARALGSLRAEIITTEYYVALMSQRTATDGDVAGLAELTQTTPDSIDARPMTVTEKAPCFAGTGGPGTTWQDRPLGEQILFGIGVAGFCAIAVASGGFCAF